MDKKKIKNVLKNTYTNTMDYLDKQGTKFEQSTLFTPKKNGGLQVNPKITNAKDAALSYYKQHIEDKSLMHRLKNSIKIKKY